MTNLTWKINKIPMTQNRALRAHWAVRRRELKVWRLLVRSVCGNPRKKVTGKVHLAITVHRSRLQDEDNRYGSVKGLIDALVRNGWLVDDSPRLMELEVFEVKCKRDECHTVIEWKEES